MVSSNISKYLKPFYLGIDIGGTGIKMLVMDAEGRAITQEIRELTPRPATVKAIMKTLAMMIGTIKVKFDRVSAGFPGVVLKDVIKTAPNLHPSWIGINLVKVLKLLTHCPSRVANDAAVQGYGDITGKGVELVITSGTGVRSALFLDGKLVPNLQLAHIPFQNNHTFEELLGEKALKRYGEKKWNDNLKKAITLWQQTFNYDKLFLGGGHAKKVKFTLPSQVKKSKNIEGILGGIKLWE